MMISLLQGVLLLPFFSNVLQRIKKKIHLIDFALRVCFPIPKLDDRFYFRSLPKVRFQLKISEECYLARDQSKVRPGYG